MGSSPITFVSSGDFDSHRLACAVTNTDAREVKPSGVDTLAHEQGGALPVLDTTPALAEGTAGVKSLAGLRKPPLQNLRRWSPRHVARLHRGTKCHHKARPGMKSRHCHERANASSTRHRKRA